MTQLRVRFSTSVASVLAMLLTAVVALYAINLLLGGELRTVVPAVPFGAPQPAPNIIHVSYPAALVPLIAAVLLLSGLITRWLSVAWIGQALLSLFAVLFLFSSGGQLLPTAGLLLILLTLLHTHNLQVTWMLFIVLLAAGVSLWFGLVWPLLPLAGLLTLVLWLLQHQPGQVHSGPS